MTTAIATMQQRRWDKAAMSNLKVRPSKSRASYTKALFLLALAAMSIAGVGCVRSTDGNMASSQVQPSAAAGASLKIVTSTLPVTGFAKAVAGDRAQVTYLLPTNVGPHDYQAKPEDVRTLAEADVLVKSGLGIDQYLDSLVENANNPNLKMIDTSQGIETISHEDGEEHAHEEEQTAAASGKEGGHDHEGEFNPHIWLDPKRAIQQVENIRDGLIAADPEGQDIYTANAAAYINQLEALDAELKVALQPYMGPIMTLPPTLLSDTVLRLSF
jgi:zinc transport system substrate-binding protein